MAGAAAVCAVMQESLDGPYGLVQAAATIVLPCRPASVHTVPVQFEVAWGEHPWVIALCADCVVTC